MKTLADLRFDVDAYKAQYPEIADAFDAIRRHAEEHSEMPCLDLVFFSISPEGQGESAASLGVAAICLESAGVLAEKDMYFTRDGRPTLTADRRWFFDEMAPPPDRLFDTEGNPVDVDSLNYRPVYLPTGVDAPPKLATDKDYRQLIAIARFFDAKVVERNAEARAK